MQSSQPLLLVDHLCQVLDGRPVLQEVCLQLEQTECVVLAGANGSGKTTLLRCLSGALTPTSGTVLWQRRSPRHPETRRQIGTVAHESRLYSHLTLRENLVFAARMCGVASAGRRADELLAETGLAAASKLLPPQVSRGMRQRLAIVRALIHDPPCLLLDEPFSSLDDEGREWLTGRLRRCCERGGCCCVSVHGDWPGTELAHRSYRLKDGRLVANRVDDTVDAVGDRRAA